MKELRRSHPARARQGFTVFFTGLSGSGKSTIANVLLSKLLELGGRPVTILDGDLVRKNLSSELGFSKEHRDINIRRIGYVAAEITKHRGIAVCAPIAPYDDIRKEVRAMIAPHGGFILVHVNTSVEECEKRDRKGLYAKARAGIIKEFTGISDPYDVPTDAEVTIDTLELNRRRSRPGNLPATGKRRLHRRRNSGVIRSLRFTPPKNHTSPRLRRGFFMRPSVFLPVPTPLDHLPSPLESLLRSPPIDHVHSPHTTSGSLTKSPSCPLPSMGRVREG